MKHCHLMSKWAITTQVSKNRAKTMDILLMVNFGFSSTFSSSVSNKRGKSLLVFQGVCSYSKGTDAFIDINQGLVHCGGHACLEF